MRPRNSLPVQPVVHLNRPVNGIEHYHLTINQDGAVIAILLDSLHRMRDDDQVSVLPAPIKYRFASRLKPSISYRSDFVDEITIKFYRHGQAESEPRHHTGRICL